MSTFVLTDVTCWCAGYDMTTDLNSLSLAVSAEEQDNTTFGGGGYRSRVGGLRSVEASLEGYWQSGTTDAIDPQAFSNLGAGGEAVTISPTGEAGSTAYMFKGGKFNYELLGGIGEVAPFSLEMMGTDPIGVVRGLVAKTKGDVSATGATGSAVQLGAGSSGQYLYLALHVFSAGTTISVKVESDDAEAFSTPSDVASATISSVTASGGTWMARVDASSFTDDWYRINVTTCTGTFSIAAALAIQ